MKQVIGLLFFCSFLNSIKAQSCEVEWRNHDTINKISVQGFKEGIWRISGKHKPKLGYPIEQVIETGYYLNNRKTGVWKEYFKNGKQRSELTYVCGLLEGPATFYDQTGKVIKQGSFKANKWVR